MNTLKTIGIAAVTAIVVLLVGLWLVSSQPGSFGATIGATFYPHSGLGARSLKVVTSTTDNTPAADGTLSVGGGSVTILRACTAVTWNPSAVSSTTLATTSVTLPNALLGDDIGVSISTSTQGLNLKAALTTNTSSLITLSAPSGFVGSVDIATTTLSVCDTR